MSRRPPTLSSNSSDKQGVVNSRESNRRSSLLQLQQQIEQNSPNGQNRHLLHNLDMRPL